MAGCGNDGLYVGASGQLARQRETNSSVGTYDDRPHRTGERRQSKELPHRPP